MEQCRAELEDASRQVEADSLQEVAEDEARRFASVSRLVQADSVERARRVLIAAAPESPTRSSPSLQWQHHLKNRQLPPPHVRQPWAASRRQ